MRTILLLAYCVSPTKGSEYSVAWNYITNMSRTNRLVVLYGKSDREMGNFDEMNDYLQTNRLDNVQFVQVKSQSKWGNEGVIYKSSLKAKIFDFMSYREWHYQAYLAASSIIKEEKIDIVHFLCPIGFKEPGYLYKLPLPYVWGPINGAHPRPQALLKALPLKQRVISTLRNITHKTMLRTSPNVSKAIKSSSLVFAATPFTKKQIDQFFGVESIYLPENAIPKIEQSYPVERLSNQSLRLVWIGRLDYNKNLSLLLDVLEMLPEIDIELNVVASGYLESYLKSNYDFKHKKPKVVWHGHVSRDEVQKILRSSHLHIITSLGEATTTVIWEAMANGIPTITLDHCGMSGVIDETCGVKIPINNHTQVKQDFAAAIKKFYETPELIKQFSKATLKHAENYIYERRYKLMDKYFDKITNDES